MALPKIDLTELDWHKLSEAGTSHGSLYKATKRIAGIAYFYKMSLMIGRKVVGHEAVNEVVVSRLLDILNIPHTRYDLYSAKVRIKGEIFDTFICVSKDFKEPGVSSVPFETYHHLVGGNSCPFEFARRLGFQKYLDQMFVVDFLTTNRDRHGFNLEILDNGEKLCLAPLFDMGYSFVAPLQNDTNLLRAYDPMQDVVANNYVGSESLFDNLRLIENPVLVSPLNERDRGRIFHDLSLAVSREHLDKIWQIIMHRYQYLVAQGYICENKASKTMLFH